MVDWNRDLRKGYELFEIAQFEDGAALERFRLHPKHHEITDILQECADWVVGDMPFAV